MSGRCPGDASALILGARVKPDGEGSTSGECDHDATGSQTTRRHIDAAFSRLTNRGVANPSRQPGKTRRFADRRSSPCAAKSIPGRGRAEAVSIGRGRRFSHRAARISAEGTSSILPGPTRRRGPALVRECFSIQRAASTARFLWATRGVEGTPGSIPQVRPRGRLGDRGLRRGDNRHCFDVRLRVGVTVSRDRLRVGGTPTSRRGVSPDCRCIPSRWPRRARRTVRSESLERRAVPRGHRSQASWGADLVGPSISAPPS